MELECNLFGPLKFVCSGSQEPMFPNLQMQASTLRLSRDPVTAYLRQDLPLLVIASYDFAVVLNNLSEVLQKSQLPLFV